VALRILVIVNSRSGGGDAGLYDYVRILGASGAEITLRFSDGATALEELATDATSFDRVVAAGGDGTASAVCYAVRDSQVPVLVYPAGTANLLAQNIGMPIEPRQLAETTLHGRVQAFDLGEIERPAAADGLPSRIGFAVMAGAGYDAAIMDSARPMKSNLGPAAYLVAAVSNLTPTAAHFELDLDGESIVTDGIAVLVVNFGRIQFDVPVAAGADPRDGIFEVAVVRTRNVAALLPAIVAGISGADKLPGIDVYPASQVSVVSTPALPMQYDGETTNAHTPFKARVLPQAASLLLPRDSAYFRER
jgi:diacylglycerol kinase family enzyme